MSFVEFYTPAGQQYVSGGGTYSPYRPLYDVYYAGGFVAGSGAVTQEGTQIDEVSPDNALLFDLRNNYSSNIFEGGAPSISLDSKYESGINTGNVTITVGAQITGFRGGTYFRPRYSFEVRQTGFHTDAAISFEDVNSGQIYVLTSNLSVQQGKLLTLRSDDERGAFVTAPAVYSKAINGTAQSEVLSAALSGNNYVNSIIVSGGGSDTLVGSQSTDTLVSTNGGNSLLIAGTGRNYLEGGNGRDTLVGGGNSRLTAGAGGNVLFTDAHGHDVLVGGVGDDILVARSGANQLTGLGSGSDQLYGGSGSDTLTALTGDNLLYAGSGQNVLQGGAGHDTLFGGGLTNMLAGQGGNFLFTDVGGSNTLVGGAGNDTLDAVSGNNKLVAIGSGSDQLYGGSGADTLEAAGGNNSLLAGSGANVLQGASGMTLSTAVADQASQRAPAVTLSSPAATPTDKTP